MQPEISTQFLRPVSVVITLYTCPTAIIKDHVAAHFQDMSCNVPHDLFDTLMSCIVFVAMFLPAIIAKELQVPNIKSQQERICLPRKLASISCFAATR